MSRDGVSDTQRVMMALLLGVLLLMVGSREATAADTQATATSASATTDSANRGLPVSFERRTGDLDVMVKSGSIRALVLYSHSSFFYVDGKPEGIFYEALRNFEQFVNDKLPHRKEPCAGYVHSGSSRPA